MIKKVKTFQSQSFEGLEEEINTWIEKEQVDVVSVKTLLAENEYFWFKAIVLYKSNFDERKIKIND